MGNHVPQYVASGKNTFGCLPHGPQFVKPVLIMSEVLYMEIGRRLEAVRKAFTSLNQKEFAEKMGFNRSQYSNWALGVRRIPLEAAEKLSSVYGLSLDWIYLGRRDGLSETASKVL